MENLRFQTQEDLDKFLSKLQFIGKGTEGKCYLWKDKWVLKVFYCQMEDEKLLQFSNIDVEGFSFIKYLIYVGDTIVGVVAPFVKGYNINDGCLSNECISDIILASSDLVLGVEEISYLSIMAWDVCTPNIIYYKGKLGVIDTRKFYYEKEGYNILPNNMSEVMKPVVNSALGYYYLDYKTQFDSLGIKHFLKSTNSEYRDYENDFCLLQNPQELLLGIKGELEEFLQMRIVRFSDAEEPLQRKLIL